MLRMLLQPRYAALTALMTVIAVICVAAGTWQIARYEQKKDDNSHLRANDRAPIATVVGLLPLVSSGSPLPSEKDVEFRRVRVTGTYDTARQSLLRNQRAEEGGPIGFNVITPLTTADGTLLVVRGFLAGSASDLPPIPAPPTGEVTVVARVIPGQTRGDAAGELPASQVESINPVQQAQRLDAPVFDGYARLLAKQPGTAKLTAIPEPDLSNPAGGALEPQHFAYVIQWYLFALLALAAPFTMIRSENKQRRTGEFDDEPGELSPEAARAAKLADRYGRTR